MAKKSNQKYRKKGPNRSNELKHFAFMMGRVNKGINNPNSQVYEAFEKGKNYSKKANKPLV